MTPEIADESSQTEEKPETLVQAWETDTGLFFELHDSEMEQDELYVIEVNNEDIDEEGNPTEDMVTLAVNVAELDEVIRLLQEIRAKMKEREENT